MRKNSLKEKRIISALILGLLPILMCGINLLINGKNFSDIWLGQSQWNDELFYFKQIECMVKDTIPKGFFGYNESSAQVLSFGAWSPVILLPWALWGKIFGWNYLSPIIANIVFLTIGMFLFGLFSRPTLKQTIWLSVLFILVTPLSRYMFSSMPEIVCLVPLLIAMGLILGYEKTKNRTGSMVHILILLSFLTLMRPYFVVFFIFPFFLTKEKQDLLRIGIVLVTLASLVLYFAMSAKTNAPYFTDVYRTDWVDAFKNEGFKAGFLYLIKELLQYLYEIVIASIGGARGGYAIGIYFAAFLMVIVEFLFFGIYHIVKKDRRVNLSLCMFFCQFAMLGAICLMYSLQDGFRHLLVFVVVGMATSVFMLTDRMIRHIVMAVNAVVLLWLFVVKASDPLYFGSVYNDENDLSSREAVYELKEELAAKMTPTSELSWDNDVALVFMDNKDGEESHLLRWQYAYALPEGFALSLCESTYVSENINDIKSNYVLTMSGGQVEKLLIEKKYKLICNNEYVAVYEKVKK